jgi:hypothetical protein
MSKAKLLAREEVHLIIDYWDGPREGVADYCGTPHYFRAVFDEKKDEWSDVFRILSPLDLDYLSPRDREPPDLATLATGI